MTPKQRIEHLGLNRPYTIFQRFHVSKKAYCVWCATEAPCQLVADVKRGDWRRFFVCQECEGFVSALIPKLKQRKNLTRQAEVEIVAPERPIKQRVLETLLTCSSPIDSGVIAANLGIHRNTATRALVELMEDGLAVRKSQSKKVGWSYLWTAVQQQQRGAA